MNERKLTDGRKKQINDLTHIQLCGIWRFGVSGDWRLQGDCGAYFKKRLFDHFGGFTVEISKSLGWG